MNKYTQGVCEDGAAILKDGQLMTIEEILDELNTRPLSSKSFDSIQLIEEIDKLEVIDIQIGEKEFAHPEDYVNKNDVIQIINSAFRGGKGGSDE